MLRTAYLEHEVWRSVDEHVVWVGCILLKVRWHALLGLHAPGNRLKEHAGEGQLGSFRLPCLLNNLSSIFHLIGSVSDTFSGSRVRNMVRGA